jgi:hypothetical protein
MTIAEDNIASVKKLKNHFENSIPEAALPFARLSKQRSNSVARYSKFQKAQQMNMKYITEVAQMLEH